MRRSTIPALVTALTFAATTAMAQCPPDATGAVVPVAEAVTGWARYDAQTVRVDGVVDHRASARANGAAFKEEWHAFTSMDKFENATELITAIPVLGAILFVAAGPVAIVADAIDLVAAPSMMVKHGTDAAAHWTLGLFQRRRSTP